MSYGKSYSTPGPWVSVKTPTIMARMEIEITDWICRNLIMIYLEQLSEEETKKFNITLEKHKGTKLFISCVSTVEQFKRSLLK